MLTRALLLGVLALWLALCTGRAAIAHPMPESQLLIDSHDDGLTLTLRLPLNRLEFAFGQPLADAPGTVLARHGTALAAYVRQHVRAHSGADGQGPAWQPGAPQLRVQGDDGAAELVAVLHVQAPPGADARQVLLDTDVITHEVRTHRIQAFLRQDWAGGVVAGDETLRLLGTLDHDHTRLPLQLGQAHAGAAVTALLAAGLWHIFEGSDHQAFVLLLLLVAPLAAQGRRWGPVRPAREALRHTAWVVSAFTLGHTVTLVLGSLGWLAPPAAVVEVAVALTIALAAVHALRPLLTRGEAPMALAFGLIHGMAFSASLSGAGLTPGQHALALLAFNLGIEGGQLALLALLLPPLLLIARGAPARFTWVRQGLALGAGVLAVLWGAQRLGADPWAAWAWLPSGAAWGPAVPMALWGLALLASTPRREAPR